MSDLETAITECSEKDANLTCWPPNEGEFIIGLFTDGCCPGEVIKVIS